MKDIDGILFSCRAHSKLTAGAGYSTKIRSEIAKERTKIEDSY